MTPKATNSKVKGKKVKPLSFHIITLFPESLSSYLNESIIARAQKEKLIKVHTYNPRDFVKPTKTQSKNEKPYLRVDDRPYGGGPGMVIQAEPILKAIEKALKTAGIKSTVNKKSGAKLNTKTLILFLSPSGEQFTTKAATDFAANYTDIVIICGRYEGIDARVKEVFKMRDITVGPFVTTGGELPAMLIIDVTARQIEGVLGKFESREEARVSSSNVYTRPEVLVYKKKKYKVPEVLLSGDHKKIDEWRLGEKMSGQK